MSETSSLKKRLIEIMKNEWVFPDNIDAHALIDELKDALSSTDSDLRDRLALTGFCNLISSEKVSDAKLRSLHFELISDNYLLNGLGKERDDSVFGRGFLIYGAYEPMEYSRKANKMLFNDGEVKNFLDIALKCFKEEKDLRGWDEEKGWAHTAAHTCDVLGGLAEDNAIGHDELIAILYAIKDKVCIDYHSFGDEHGRFAEAIIQVLKRELISENEFSEWVTSFLKCERPDDSQKARRLMINISEFFWAMRWRFKKNYPNLYPYVLKTLVELLES